MRKKLVLLTILIASLLASLASPLLAQIKEPDTPFQIASVEAYRHCLELNDQLYLITGTIEYTSPPTNYTSAQSYTVRVMDGVTELGNTTFYPMHDNGYDYGLCSIYLTAAQVTAFTTALGHSPWNAVQTAYLQGNPTLHWLDTTAVTAMSGAIADDSGLLTNETAASNSAAIDDMTLMPAIGSVQVNDAYYFGSSGMFNILTLNISTAGSWTGTLAWEYWTGSQWTTVGFLTDNTARFTAGVGNYNVTFTCPSNWQPSVVSGLNLYWLRARVATFTAPLVTQPLGAQSWTNTLATPPSVNNSAITWHSSYTTIVATQTALTIRLRSLAQAIEDVWGGTADLIESIAGINKLTDSGEEYFTNSIANLRTMCPNLFADAMTTPDFSEQGYVRNFYMGGDDISNNAGGVNWFAQTFTPTSNYSINGVELKMFRVGAAPGVLTVGIRDTAALVPLTNGGGLPDRLTINGVLTDTVPGTLNANLFTTSTTGDWYHATFGADYPLVAGTLYAIVVRSAANFTGIRAVTVGTYAGGQACSSGNAGVGWIPTVPVGRDYLFAVHAAETYSTSYRDKLASRLVGTNLDMTWLATNLNTSRMWISTMIWFIFACLLPTFYVCKAVGTFKPATMVFAIMLPVGALAGFVYLELAVIAAFLFALATIYIFFYSKAG